MYHPTCHLHLPLWHGLSHDAPGQSFSAQGNCLGCCSGWDPKIQRDCVPTRAPLSVCSGVSVQLHQDKAWECHQQLGMSTLYEVLTELLTNMSNAAVWFVLRTPIFQQCSASKRRLLSAQSEQKAFSERHGSEQPGSFWLRRAWVIPSLAGLCLSPSGCHGKTESSPFLDAAVGLRAAPLFTLWWGCSSGSCHGGTQGSLS